MVSSKDDSASVGEYSSGEAPDSNSGLFSEDEKVLASMKPRFKKQSCERMNGDILFQKAELWCLSNVVVSVLQGWNNIHKCLIQSWDEWMGTDHLMKYTEENILKQQALQKKQGEDKASKPGR